MSGTEGVIRGTRLPMRAAIVSLLGAALAGAQAPQAPPNMGDLKAFLARRGIPSGVLTRAEWGAVDPKAPLKAMPTATRITVHHTMEEFPEGLPDSIGEMRRIQELHMRGRRNACAELFDDIGYHGLIAPDGTFLEGRPFGSLGAHAGGVNNRENIGISLMGDFRRPEDKALGAVEESSRPGCEPAPVPLARGHSPTPAQMRTLEAVILFLAEKHDWKGPASGFIFPHRHFRVTECPGAALLSELDGLKVRVDAELPSLRGR
ncbi:MAG: N-acetylmuramoyl-L-alanine amidase [Elusimicrobia bacterium]|nr:N-acetylmuramoyl-L-alanine amidase [Elusimicrobiota bacterium]